MQLTETARAKSGSTEKPGELKGLAVELHRALNDFVRQYQFRNRSEICCYGITVSQCHLLQALKEKRLLSMRDLASYLCLQISTVTRLVDGLVKKRLVRRRRDSEDKRVVRVEMTESGTKVLEKITQDLLAREEELLTSLSEDVRKGVVEAISMLLQQMAPASRSAPGR